MLNLKPWLLSLFLLLTSSFPGLGFALGASVPSEGPALHRAKLLYLPFLAPGISLKEAGLNTFDQWVLGALASVQPEFSLVSIEKFPRAELPAEFELSLPELRSSRRAREIFEPLYSHRKTDGGLCFWLERLGKGNYRMVSLLYLPRRLSLMAERVSLNLEHAPVALSADGRFTAQEVKRVARALLERSFSRIVDEESLASREERQTPSAEEQTAPGASLVDPDSEPTSPKPTATDPPEAAPLEEVTVEPPLRLGVLELSWDLMESMAEVAGSLSQDALDFKLLHTRSLRALESLDEIQRATALEVDPWTFDEIEAPTLALDPRADPKAKERLLAQQTGDLDGLIFGHLRQHKDEGGRLRIDLYLRLFLKDTLQVFTGSSRWLQARKSEALRKTVEETARQALAKAFVGVAPDDRPIWIFPKPNEGLERIVRRCYGKLSARKVSRLAEQLAKVNGVENPQLIARDRKLRIPPKLGGKNRKTPPCL